MLAAVEQELLLSPELLLEPLDVSAFCGEGGAPAAVAGVVATGVLPVLQRQLQFVPAAFRMLLAVLWLVSAMSSENRASLGSLGSNSLLQPGPHGEHALRFSIPAPALK